MALKRVLEFPLVTTLLRGAHAALLMDRSGPAAPDQGPASGVAPHIQVDSRQACPAEKHPLRAAPTRSTASHHACFRKPARANGRDSRPARRAQADPRGSARVLLVDFDEAGRLGTARFQEQQSALAESALDRVFTAPGDDDRVLDAASRFVPQGRQWRPSNDLAQRIDDMALGKA